MAYPCYGYNFNVQYKTTRANTSMNHVGDVGATALADALRSPSCTLARLDLRCNEVNATHGNAAIDTDVMCACLVVLCCVWVFEGVPDEE